ncbi:MAG: methyltransferase domain-containing protein [Proteobacteria bacterium]|nr:methyltransferase domain-containing protein [Pseudomonadota bacterium]MBI3497206.1 methyltransferase domain-containing protein [Pseudomonadota bacterium]
MGENILDLAILRCPLSGQPLEQRGDRLVTKDGEQSYPIDEHGIPQFVRAFRSSDAAVQQELFDGIGSAYVAHLNYPQTIAYTRYLDDVLLAEIGDRDLGVVVEACCGGGESRRALGARIKRCIGIDVSLAMLRSARKNEASRGFTYLQADATKTPLADACADTVLCLGGIHHVPDRAALFAEFARILKPGGRLYYREPLSDFVVWRWLRSLVYRLAPALDSVTEQPLRWRETVPVLEQAGLVHLRWRPAGFIGFCLFMNSDVLIVNRLFRFVPGIRAVVEGFARFDDWVVRQPALARLGLQVIGVAARPA